MFGGKEQGPDMAWNMSTHISTAELGNGMTQRCNIPKETSAPVPARRDVAECRRHPVVASIATVKRNTDATAPACQARVMLQVQLAERSVGPQSLPKTDFSSVWVGARLVLKQFFDVSIGQSP